MNNRLSQYLCSCLVLCMSVSASYADTGRSISFTIDENGRTANQTANVQYGKVFLARSGGDPNTDILFESDSRVLYIVNHQSRGFYRIDDAVINKAASMLESLSEVAKSQQGVLGDLLDTLGLSGEEEEVDIRVVQTDTVLNTAGVDCLLMQQFKNNILETELCVAEQSELAILGDHIVTLNEFYLFGDNLLSKAGAILSNMGVIMPNLRKLNSDDRLPVMAYVHASRLKVVLTGIKETDLPPSQFSLPEGYSQIPIPFIN